MEEISFFEGIVLGALLSFVVFIGYIYFELKGKNKVHEAIKKVEQAVRPQAKIFMPPTEEEEAQQEIIDKNKRAGRGTEAEELGI